jgi:hypothetical protein
MIVQGVEMALLANDASGAPVPYLMCCPWLFFDGKLFHSKLRRAVLAQNLMEMCGQDMQLVIKVGILPTHVMFSFYSVADPDP